MIKQLNLFEGVMEQTKTSITERIHEKAKTVKIPFSKKLPKYDSYNIINTLQKRIDSAQKKIDNISTEISGNWTPKRGREAQYRRQTKESLQSKLNALKRIKEDWKTKKCNPLLVNIRSITDIEKVLVRGYPNPLDGTESDYFLEKYNKQIKACKRLNLTAENENEFKALLKDYCIVYISEAEKKERALQKAIIDLRGRKIPGFFPTPLELINKMIDYSKMFEKRNMNILEPSAGIGDIADAIKDLDYGHKIDCVEINYELCKILELKGYDTIDQRNILDYNVGGFKYDRIVMNPPFERGQDIEHITHCYNNFLKEDGILVSLASAGVMSNSRQKYKEFRDLVINNGQFVELDGNEFKEAFNSTNVKTVLVYLNK